MVEKKVVKEFEVVQVATQTAPVIVLGDEQYTTEQVLVLVLNKLVKLEQGLL